MIRIDITPASRFRNLRSLSVDSGGKSGRRPSALLHLRSCDLAALVYGLWKQQVPRRTRLSHDAIQRSPSHQYRESGDHQVLRSHIAPGAGICRARSAIGGRVYGM